MADGNPRARARVCELRRRNDTCYTPTDVVTVYDNIITLLAYNILLSACVCVSCAFFFSFLRTGERKTPLYRSTVARGCTRRNVFFFTIYVCVLTGDFYLFIFFYFYILLVMMFIRTPRLVLPCNHLLQRCRPDILRGPRENNFLFHHHFFVLNFFN